MARKNWKWFVNWNFRHDVTTHWLIMWIKRYLIMTRQMSLFCFQTSSLLFSKRRKTDRAASFAIRISISSVIIIGDLYWLNSKHDLFCFSLVKTTESDNRLTEEATSNRSFIQTNIMPCIEMLINRKWRLFCAVCLYYSNNESYSITKKE